MKKLLLLPALALVAAFTACGPAAEDREAMHRRAKVFQDSIAAVIRASMDEAAQPGPAANNIMMAPNGTAAVQAAGTATAAPTATQH